MNNPYVEIANKAIKNLKVYGTVIVRIRIDGICFNEILSYNAVDNCWEWENDWYEGQKNIEFIGSISLDDVKVVNDETV